VHGAERVPQLTAIRVTGIGKPVYLPAKWGWQRFV